MSITLRIQRAALISWTYLIDWRLTLARDCLPAGELTLEQIARRTGYIIWDEP
jgi:transcriptional regulator GlxA family with amidase domain